MKSESYGSIDTDLLFRLHPKVLFLYHDESGEFISEKNLSLHGGYNYKTLDYVKNDVFKERLKPENLAEVGRLKQKKTDLSKERDLLFREYSSSVAQRPSNREKLDEEYLLKRGGLNQQIADLSEKIEKKEENLLLGIMADEKERERIISSIKKDCIEQVTKFKKKKGINVFFLYPGIPDDVQKTAMKVYITDISLKNKINFDEKDKKRFTLFLNRSFSFHSEVAMSRENYMLYGGRDHTIEILEMLYDHYRVEQVVSETVFSRLKTEERK